MITRGIVFKSICCGLIILGISSLSGCRDSWPFTPPEVESVPSPAEMKQYRQAISAYHQERYTEAVKSFEQIRSKTRDKRFALMALYGLASSKLMAAETPEEYNNALLLWRRWVDNAPGKFEYEDPTLVDALIREKMLFSNIPLDSGESQDATSEPMVSRWLLIESKLELNRLRGELANSKKTLDKRQKKIQAQDRKIGELKRQIRALETIDHKIQEKKNAIPSADSAPQR